MEIVERAARDAWAAFRTYGRLPSAERAQLLRHVANGIQRLGDELIDAAGAETALAAARLRGESARTINQLLLFAAVADEDKWPDERVEPADPSRKPMPRPRIRSALMPIGPVAVFGASNFPLAFSVAGGDTAAALAVGCPVIVKAHPAHPRTSQLVGGVIRDAVRECGLPAGVFSLLFDAPGDSYELGLALVRHPLVKAGAFTGSLRGGLALWRAAQERREPIPFFAEMGSVNPVFLFPQSLAKHAEAIATGLHASITGSLGQLCTKPGLLFLSDSPDSVAFLDRLTSLMNATPSGTLLTPAIEGAYVGAVEARGRTSGVRTCTRPMARGLAAPTLHTTDAATFVAAADLREEIFGPASLAVICAEPGDFVRCAVALEGQLTASVWAEIAELAGQEDLLWTLEQKAGRIIYNGFPTGVELGTAMMHGGPFPATTDPRFTSVGTRSILRFVRPVAWQTPI